MAIKLSSDLEAVRNEIDVLKSIKSHLKEFDSKKVSRYVPSLICNGSFEVATQTIDPTVVSFYIM
tara:strand:+ start:160 stop:354 length:195 start_codon:yes stop_codon:yes gene_type:complete